MKFMVRPRDGFDLGAQQIKIIESAVDQIFSVPLATGVSPMSTQLLRGCRKAGQEDLGSRFEVWTKARGWLFNNGSTPGKPPTAFSVST